MSKRDNILLLKDMHEAAGKILSYTHGMNFDDFRKDDRTVDAVIRNFEIIGEAANRLEGDFKKGKSEIQWDKMRGFRNRIIHEYFGIDIEIVWQIIEDDIEVPIQSLAGILNQTGP
jgi:uncharacterized protein with HEPN domain